MAARSRIRKLTKNGKKAKKKLKANYCKQTMERMGAYNDELLFTDGEVILGRLRGRHGSTT